MKNSYAPRMLFGTHEGELLTDLGTRYLLWITSQRFMAKKYPYLLHDLIDEISQRVADGDLRRDLFGG